MKIDLDLCIGNRCGCARFCTSTFNCPGLHLDGDSGCAEIDEAICNGCGVCASICPNNAIIKEPLR